MAPYDADSAQVAPCPLNDPSMFQIFQNVQYNVVQHKKYIKELKKIYRKKEQQAFRNSFSNALHYIFTFGDTSANVDRVIQFVASFCTALDDEEDFLLFIFDIIFNCQCVSGQSVRYRASQLLAAVLAALGDDASLDDDLCDKLLASQMQRLQDTRGAVRCRAALALQRLQNPMEPDDEVTRAYRFHMSCDPSSSVRRAVVMSIAKCTRNVPHVLERLVDVDEAVRRAAFLYISAINVTQLRVKQRVHVLKVGLTERSARVRRVVEEILIPGWLSVFKGNIIDLLKAVRLDNKEGAKDSQYVAGKLLESLFKRLPTSELLEWLPTDKTLRLIPADMLSKETAWYWRHLAEHLLRQDDDETLESVLPDLVVLAGYIRAIVEAPCPSELEDPVGFSMRQYVLHELARLLLVYDAGDEVGRSTLQKLIADTLTGDHGPMSKEVIRAFVAAVELILPEVSQRVEFVNAVITELREPSEPDPVVEATAGPAVESTEVKLQRARLRVSLNVAMEAQEEAVREENYVLASECKAKVADIQKKLEDLNIQPVPAPLPLPVPVVQEKVSDAATLTKCLTILNCALDTTDITSITPLLQIMFNDLQVEILQNPDILESSLETVALYGMLDKEFAKENRAFFFAHLVDTSNEVIVCTVLRCLADLLCVHGARLFEEDGDEGSLSEADTDTSRKRNRLLYDASQASVLDGDDASGVILSPGHGTVIELLLKIMDSTCSAYRMIIVECLCRLLTLGHLESPSILSRILLLWFNPATVEEDLLRQTIGVFFQSFAVMVDGAQDQIQKATLPTLRALANAPGSSPIAEIDQEAVVRFLVSLTRVNHEMGDSQGGMAVMLCSHLVKRPEAGEAPLICRTLALLAPPRDTGTCTDLARALRDVCQKLPDKQSCRNLTRYLGALEASERASLNKITCMGATLTDASSAIDDFTNRVSHATTSMQPPLARSTHVVINETVEEEVEIDKTSPTEVAEHSTEPLPDKTVPAPVEEPSTRTSVDSKKSLDAPESERRESEAGFTEIESGGEVPLSRESSSDGSSTVSSVKKPRVTKKGKKSLSTRKSGEAAKGSKEPATGTQEPAKGKKSADKLPPAAQALERGPVKRSRSQRSVEVLPKAKPISTPETPAQKPTKHKEKETEDTPRTALRRSSRSILSSTSTESTNSAKTTSSKTSRKSSEILSSGSATSLKTQKTRKSTEKLAKATRKSGSKKSIGSRSSTSSLGEPFGDLADETELHTIVYDKEMEQSLMASSDDEQAANCSRNVTIPQTPETSERSESEPEESPKIIKTKRTKGKK